MSIQSEYHGCRSRACLEGRMSRRRRYYCRVCKEKFQVDTLRELPLKSRICQVCLQDPLNRKAYDDGFIERQEREEAKGLIP